MKSVKVKEMIEKLSQYDPEADIQVRFETYATRNTMDVNYLPDENVVEIEVE